MSMDDSSVVAEEVRPDTYHGSCSCGKEAQRRLLHSRANGTDARVQHRWRRCRLHVCLMLLSWEWIRCIDLFASLSLVVRRWRWLTWLGSRGGFQAQPSEDGEVVGAAVPEHL